MFAIIGIVVVLGAVAGGYTMEHGNFKVLVQTGGAADHRRGGTGDTADRQSYGGGDQDRQRSVGVLKGSRYTKASYLETLKMLNDLFMVARKSGMAKLEEDIENPEKSQVFSKYPKFWRTIMPCISCATRCGWRSAAACRRSTWTK